MSMTAFAALGVFIVAGICFQLLVLGILLAIITRGFPGEHGDDVRVAVIIVTAPKAVLSVVFVHFASQEVCLIAVALIRLD